MVAMSTPVTPVVAKRVTVKCHKCGHIQTTLGATPGSGAASTLVVFAAVVTAAALSFEAA
jgi:hypothetical protein